MNDKFVPTEKALDLYLAATMEMVARGVEEAVKEEEEK